MLSSIDAKDGDSGMSEWNAGESDGEDSDAKVGVGPGVKRGCEAEFLSGVVKLSCTGRGSIWEVAAAGWSCREMSWNSGSAECWPPV